MRNLSCGHEPSPHSEHTTGTAVLPNGNEVCWTCADEWARSRLRNGQSVTGYLSHDGKAINTWSGGKLADVTSSVVRTLRSRHTRYKRTYWSANGEGLQWCGSSEGPGMVTTMRVHLHKAKG